VPLLPDLLRATAEARRLGGEPLREREGDIDELQRALRERAAQEAERAQTARLSALAEFAAGAGHEFNNPLAVISGQAQYLLGHADEWFTPGAGDAPRKALQTVVAQTRRIHAALRELMTFSRPSPPRPLAFDLPTLLGEVADSLHELADARRVRLEVDAPDRLAGRADVEQLRQALTCLLKNAIEAAPPDGWARLRLELPQPGAVAVAVEDSGPGPDPEQVPYLFDPFYSGRSAGRGRGLGLPIAWRLARLQGGGVRLDPPRLGQPTRFLLTLPAAPSVEPAPPLALVNGRH
jgi:signal transduction histidine kinase